MKRLHKVGEEVIRVFVQFELPILPKYYGVILPKCEVYTVNQRVSGKRTTRRNGESGNMGAVSDDGSSGIEDGLRELHNSTGESKTVLG